ncbi:MAG: methylated-DNA--[protein]-cysteine S-methyltransferase [Alphaproteobacteria bacterium]|nr:methylated-DNA--[protein]-cysteine S-methyltransferase [Alphaproteobacteria bacterium]
MSYYTYYNSPVGRLLMECDDIALTGLWIENQKYYAVGADKNMAIYDNHPIFIEASKWLDAYFNSKTTMGCDLPLRPRGTDFQQRVWSALCTIPYGKTRTYGDIANQLNAHPRAVGGAVGRNPILIIIPCHRVLGTGGTMTGYAAGTDIKQTLLKLEKSPLA